MKAKHIPESIGAKTSLEMGLRAGIVSMILYAIFSVVVTDESFFMIMFFFINGYSTLGFLIAFAIALWFAGIMMQKDIPANGKELWATFKYSTVVNCIIWPVFILIHLIVNKEIDTYFGWIIPLELAFISIIFTPFTIGQWIYKRIKIKIASI